MPLPEKSHRCKVLSDQGYLLWNLRDFLRHFTQGGFSGSQEFCEIERSLKQVSHEYLGSEMYMVWCWRFPHFGTVSDAARAKIPNYISDLEFCVISALSDFAGNIPKLHKNWETYGDTGVEIQKISLRGWWCHRGSNWQRKNLSRRRSPRKQSTCCLADVESVAPQGLRWNWNLNCIIQQKLNY